MARTKAHHAPVIRRVQLEIHHDDSNSTKGLSLLHLECNMEHFVSKSETTAPERESVMPFVPANNPCVSVASSRALNLEFMPERRCMTWKRS